MPLDFDRASRILSEEFRRAETLSVSGDSPECEASWSPHFEVIFRTRVQAYREVLLGCTLARLLDRTIDVRLPYANQGDQAYNGRTLDERVVNPFLQANRVPSSKGPFLNVFRRSVKFDLPTREGLRDKKGYDAFLALISVIEQSASEEQTRLFLSCLLHRFAKLRESADIPLTKVQRLSLEQFRKLADSLLVTPSGGRFPVLLVVATLRTINEFFDAGWEIAYQGINVADSQTGAGGDVTVSKNGAIVFAAEITERPLHEDRLVQTFNSKIGPNAIGDYLFFVRLEALAAEAREKARQFFAQGHEVNFLSISEWLPMVLATVGAPGRALFLKILIGLMADSSVPSSMKVAWNHSVSALVAD